MPRTRLDPNYWERFARSELSDMKRKDIAEKLNITPQAASYKVRNLAFSLKELHALNLTDDQILRIVRGIEGRTA